MDGLFTKIGNIFVASKELLCKDSSNMTYHLRQSFWTVFKIMGRFSLLFSTIQSS